MDDLQKAALAANATTAWKMASNWVMGAAGTMFAVYLMLPLEQQQSIVSHLPVPAWVLPIVTSILGIAARLWPQHGVGPLTGVDPPPPKE